jgi:ATP-dependent DNA helicase RecG
MKVHNDISDFIRAGENENLEFKSNFNDQVIETIVAFSNTSGGTIFIGVDNKGSVLGLSLGKETLQNWINEIKQKTSPVVFPELKELMVEGKIFVRIKVPEFPVKPVAYKGRYYKRIGNSNHLMSALEIAQINIQTLQTSWDAFPARNLKIKDLDIQKVNKFLERINVKGRYQLQNNWKENLEKLRLIEGKSITNAAWLLFGKGSPGYNVHIGRFKTPSMIIGDKMLNETLFEAVEETMRYIVGQIKVAFEITGIPTSRTEIFEYPLPALRELVLNSIIHRDYTSPIDIQIKVFDDSISFYNPGDLFGNLTIDDLKRDNYRANARNKLIAEAFYLTGDIEKYGTGFIRIRKEIESYPTMLFDFDEIPNGFLATLKYKIQRISTKDVTDNVVDNVIDNVVDNIVNNVVGNIKDTKAIIVRLLHLNSRLSAKLLAKELNLSERSVQRYLKSLTDHMIIKHIGPAKGGYWEILTTNNTNLDEFHKGFHGRNIEQG